MIKWMRLRMGSLAALGLLLIAQNATGASASWESQWESALGGQGGWFCAHGHWHGAPVDSPDYKKFAPDREVDILHLKLEVTPDFENRSVNGMATLDFQPIRYPLSRLRLDAVDLRIHDVTASHPIRSWYNNDRELQIMFTDPIPAGETAFVTVRYDATPEKGLYFRTTEMGYRAGDVHLFTQGETTEARHWYPSHDFPNEKFTTEIHCRVPVEMTVLSNGRKLGETVDGTTGMKTVRWRTEKPHVNYLVSLVAGYFQSLETTHNGLPLAFHTAPSQFHMAERSMADTIPCLDYFVSEIGVPYPWEKYDQVCVQDFMWGGMENTSVTTLTDRTLSVPEMETLSSSTGLVAHELAHQWFGDLITCKEWAHVWLNEGFATYYTLLFTRHKEGQDAFKYDLWNTGQSILRLSLEADRRPIVFREYDRDIEALIPSVMVYNKGAWVLHMLRSQLGEEPFRVAVQTFLERHAYDTVVTHDWIRILEEVTGRSLDGFFDQWVFRRHHPHLTIEHSWDEAMGMSRISVQQTQPVSADVALFRFPLTVRFKGAFGSQDLRVEVSDVREDFHIRLPSAPEQVRVDPDLELLAKIRFEPARAMLEKQAVAEDDMMGRLLAVQRLGDFKDLKAVTLLEERLLKDSFYGVRDEAARSLGKIANDKAVTALAKGIVQEDARVRRTVAEELGRRPSAESLAALHEMMSRESNPGVISTLISQLGGYSLDEVQDLVEAGLRTESFRDQVSVAAIRLLSGQGATEYLNELVDQVEEQPTVYPMSGLAVRLSALGRLGRISKETGAIRQLLQARVLQERSEIRLAALRALGDLGDPRSEAFLSTWSRHGDTRVAETAAAALNRVRADQPPRVEARDVREGMEGLRRETDSLKEQLKRLESRLKALATEKDKEEEAEAGPEEASPKE